MSLTELQLMIGMLGEELRAHLCTNYPWLPLAVVSLFSVANSIRIFAYIPQIYKAATDKNGASAISYTTWSVFFLSHLTTVAYALVQLADLVMALIFLGNALACFVILLVTACKRNCYRKQAAPR